MFSSFINLIDFDLSSFNKGNVKNMRRIFIIEKIWQILIYQIGNRKKQLIYLICFMAVLL